MVTSSSVNASVDSFLVLERKLVARKDPEGETTASRGEMNPPGSASPPMVSLAKSEAPFALQSRMRDPLSARAMQALTVPPAKYRERIALRQGTKEWIHACSSMFHNLISPFDPPDAKRSDSVLEKDNSIMLELRLPRRILSACLGVRAPLSMKQGLEAVVCGNDSRLLQIRIDPSPLPDARYSPSNEYSKQ
jgi:hypothetical protein